MNTTSPNNEKATMNPSSSLSPLSEDLRKGLTAICILSSLSLLSTSPLLLHLTRRLTKPDRNPEAQAAPAPRSKQTSLLLLNLLLADVQLSLAFLLNAAWLRHNAILVDTTTCRTQGWFLSSGTLASALFALLIVLHVSADLVWDVRLGRPRFALALLASWVFVSVCASIGLAVHPRDFYVRAGAGCGVNEAYRAERLWLGDFWILVAESGAVVGGAWVWLVGRRREENPFDGRSFATRRRRGGEGASVLALSYPVVHVVCALPFLVTKLKIQAEVPVSLLEVCVAGAFATSTGWLDAGVYLYMAMSRRSHRSLIPSSSSSETPIHHRSDETSFRPLSPFTLDSDWRPDQYHSNDYGNTTTIHSTNRRPPLHQRLSSRTVILLHRRVEGEDEIGNEKGMVGMVKTETVVEVVRSGGELASLGQRGGSSSGGSRKEDEEEGEEDGKARRSDDIPDCSVGDKREEDCEM